MHTSQYSSLFFLMVCLLLITTAIIIIIMEVRKPWDLPSIPGGEIVACSSSASACRKPPHPCHHILPFQT